MNELRGPDRKRILYITVPLLLMVSVICATLIINMYNPFTIRMEMDDNTLRAVEIMGLNNTYTRSPETERLYLNLENSNLSVFNRCENQTLVEATCDCAKNTSTPCMAMCFECKNNSVHLN